LTGCRAADRTTGFSGPTGEAHGASDLRRGVLAPAVTIANEQLEEVPLQENLTPHNLTHTFALLLVALGVDPGSVMEQLGHTGPAFTLRVYRHGMRRDSEPGRR
jgi:integrase